MDHIKDLILLIKLYNLLWEDFVSYQIYSVLNAYAYDHYEWVNWCSSSMLPRKCSFNIPKSKVIRSHITKNF